MHILMGVEVGSKGAVAIEVAETPTNRWHVKNSIQEPGNHVRGKGIEGEVEDIHSSPIGSNFLLYLCCSLITYPVESRLPSS